MGCAHHTLTAQVRQSICSSCTLQLLQSLHKSMQVFSILMVVAAQGCPELPQADLKALPSPSHREATTTDQAQAHQQLLKTPLTPTVPQLQEKGSPSPAGCSGGSSNSVVARVPAVVGKACVYSMADRASESVRSKGPGGGGLTKFARKRFAEANTTQPASKHWRLGYALTVWLAS